jgi:hypothetical protein
MSDKQHILDSIAAIAKRLGRTPSFMEFVAHAEISKYSLLRFFPKWNEAVRAAGLQPCRLYVRAEDSELLNDWGETARKKQAVPTRRVYLTEGKYEPSTLEKRFGHWSTLPEAFHNFAEGKSEWADVLALLPVSKPKEKPAAKAAKENSPSSIPPKPSSIPPKKVQHAPFQDRLTYGNPLDFRGLRHEPVNEQGVVLLFGMVAKELGYMVEAVQTGFPDCEAKRQIAPERWQRVRIEFEFESRKFREHGHPSTGCDVIVCWRHNWDDCPGQIEIVELSSVIKSLPNSED